MDGEGGGVPGRHDPSHPGARSKEGPTVGVPAADESLVVRDMSARVESCHLPCSACGVCPGLVRTNPDRRNRRRRQLDGHVARRLRTLHALSVGPCSGTEEAPLRREIGRRPRGNECLLAGPGEHVREAVHVGVALVGEPAAGLRLAPDGVVRARLIIEHRQAQLETSRRWGGRPPARCGEADPHPNRSRVALVRRERRQQQPQLRAAIIAPTAEAVDARAFDGGRV
eukprot:650160-Prymnesium_polylepis.2